MTVFVSSLITLILQIVWVVQVFISRFHLGDKSQDLNISNAKPPEPPPRKPSTKTKPKQQPISNNSESRISSNLLLNLSKDSLLNLSDIVTPMEEEMLRCLCAKGYTTKRAHRRKKLDTIREACIPRDTFTNIWIDSCTV